MRSRLHFSNDIIVGMRPRIGNWHNLTSRTTLQVWIICILPVPIWLCSAALESDILGTMAALLGVWLSVLWGRRLLSHPRQMLGFLKIGAISLVTIMSLGWLIALYLNTMVLDQSISQALEFYLSTTTSAYAGAVAFALCFASVLGRIGDFSLVKKLESSAVARLGSIQSVSLYKLLTLIIYIVALEIFLILNGVISYRAFAVEGYDEGSIAWFIPMLEILFATQILLNGLVINLLIRDRDRSLIKIGVVLISFLLLLFIYFTRGRSSFILSAILHGYWFCFFYGKLPPMKMLVPAIVCLVPILFFGSLFNNFMRSSNAGLSDIRTVGIASVLGDAVNTWQSDQSLQEFEKARSAVNLASRPLVAHPLAKCMSLPSERKEYMLGENLFNSTIWAIPSVIVGDKSDYPVQENLLYKHFPVGMLDTADSVYLYAYTDFSFAGIFIYPLVIATLWICSLWIARIPLISTLGVVVIVSSWIPFFTLSIGESSLVGWFGHMRNLSLALLICIPLAWIFGFIRRPRDRR